MTLLKRPFLTAIVAASLLLVATPYAGQRQEQIHGQYSKPSLGIEVSQTRPFFLQAATSNKVTSAVIKVPILERKAAASPVSAIKLEPKVERGKVRVTVYAIYGDTEGLKKCLVTCCPTPGNCAACDCVTICCKG